MHFTIQELLQHYGYWGILIALLFEMIGVPFPGETILTLSGIEWKQGIFSLVPLIIVAICGNILGSTGSYLIGRFLGRTVILRFGKFIGITEQKFNKANTMFHKYGALIVFFGKFIAGIRVLAAYLAGINRMSFWKFSLYNAIGSLLWICIFIVFGRYVDIAWQNYHQVLRKFLLPSIILILIVLITIFFKKYKKT